MLIELTNNSGMEKSRGKTKINVYISLRESVQVGTSVLSQKMFECGRYFIRRFESASVSDLLSCALVEAHAG